MGWLLAVCGFGIVLRLLWLWLAIKRPDIHDKIMELDNARKW